MRSISRSLPTKVVSWIGRFVEGAQLRKLVDEAVDVQLVYPHRECEIFESARAEIAEAHPLRQRLFDESTSRVREEHLAAVTGGGDPRRTVDVDAQVVVSAEDGLASVHPHPHP